MDVLLTSIVPALISYLISMSVSARHVLNVDGGFNQMMKAEKRRRLIWTGIFEFTNE
jgi:hypothetical protein